ncbi:transcriptional regulator [Paenibacillus sp. N1-5-1-14]|uniref:helix-turn-helix transcriptional regulator n=1 Tax=Paenibacillus radicibacter TaxID=2972488 RepID=UPI002158C9C4|nr:metalloregulator ArsR/SmtB family transcription factor [Paenibacillus radicibacter]MCR8643212.1 transcriptional regulator [Paenibacillus radicibacter]
MKHNEPDLSTRRIILNMLKTSGPLSARDITDNLEITEMAVRRHIQTLERDGLIKSSLLRQSMGRPTSVYTLTEQAEELFPKNYHQLTLDFLDLLCDEDGDEKMVEKLFEKRQNKLHDKYQTSMKDMDLAEKVNILSEIQNANGYMTELEQADNGDYILKEFNCPISQIANQYNQACQCELKLFESLLDVDVTRTECLAKDGNKCVYVISNPDKKKNTKEQP